MRTLLAVVLIGGWVAGCAGDYETFQPPPLDFGDRAPLRFAVDTVAVESAYRPRGTSPFIENTLVLTPEAATRALLEQRLQAAGGPGRLVAVIVDASVQERALETKSGLTGYLTDEPAARFEGRLKVRVDHLDAAGKVARSVSTTATRSRALPEDVSYAERQRLGYELVRALVDDLDGGLSTDLRETFADILRP